MSQLHRFWNLLKETSFPKGQYQSHEYYHEQVESTYSMQGRGRNTKSSEPNQLVMNQTKNANMEEIHHLLMKKTKIQNYQTATRTNS